jgi:hypothetical protein
MEGSYSRVDLAVELVGSPNPSYEDGIRHVLGDINYNNGFDSSNVVIQDGDEEFCYRAEAWYIGCEEPEGWLQVVGQGAAVIAYDHEPCDGCGCYVEDSAPPRLECL